jgi:hypothetical protein
MHATYAYIYRMVKKSLCTFGMFYVMAIFKSSVVWGLFEYTESRLTLTPSVIPNSNYVIMVSD